MCVCRVRGHVMPYAPYMCSFECHVCVYKYIYIYIYICMVHYCMETKMFQARSTKSIFGGWKIQTHPVQVFRKTGWEQPEMPQFFTLVYDLGDHWLHARRGLGCQCHPWSMKGPECGKAEFWFVLCFLWFCTLCQNFTGISSEFHQNFTWISQHSPEIHQKFTRIPNWSTLNKGMTTTQPSRNPQPGGVPNPNAIVRATGWL